MEMEVAKTIHSQIGGQMFVAMTGSKIVRYDDYSITYRLARNMSGANELKIALNGRDLYDIEFSKHSYPKLNTKTFEFSKEKKTIVKKYEDIYCDQLEELFKETTGLETRLF